MRYTWYCWTRQCVILVLAIAIAMQLYMLYTFESGDEHCYPVSNLSTVLGRVPRRPIAIITMEKDDKKRISQGMMLCVNVLHKLGYHIYSSRNLTFSDGCDMIWSHYYPFNNHKLMQHFINNRHNEKINHFPGIRWLANKILLNTEGDVSKYIPRTFRMPRDKQKFIKEVNKTRNVENEQLWVEKKTEHRNISVKIAKDIDLDSNIIVQKLIRNQMLIHGHVFSIGVWVVITSASPLRVYALDNEWTVRIASKPYNPDNYSDFHTFISNSASISFYEFGPMLRYYDVGYRRKHALFAHMRSDLGLKQSEIQYLKDQMFDAIQDSVYKRRNLLKRTHEDKNIGKYSSFFELMRWDFVMDENMKLYLLEANMSPNLYDVRQQHNHIARNIILNTITTIGYRHGSGKTNGIRDGDINVDLKICFTPNCANCLLKECLLCSKCLTNAMREILRTSYMEQVNRLGLRRVYPKPMIQNEAQIRLKEFNFTHISRELVNEAWMTAKCVEEQYWCT